MPTLEASGTQAATVTTEHTLATQTNNKTFVLVVDCNAMVAGDVLELRIKTKVLTGGTLRSAYLMTFYGAQPTDDLVKFSVPIPSDIEAVFTLKQTFGTSRSYPWKVLSL